VPTYEYECTRCGLVIEEFKPITAKKRQRCPSCRGKVNQLISGGLGVVFKGDGFYVNDSRKQNAGGTSQKQQADLREQAADTAKDAKAKTSEKKAEAKTPSGTEKN
jgi:putative FmdB family regulatory protein